MPKPPILKTNKNALSEQGPGSPGKKVTNEASLQKFSSTQESPRLVVESESEVVPYPLGPHGL